MPLLSLCAFELSSSPPPPLGKPNPVLTLPEAFVIFSLMDPPAVAADSLREANMVDIFLLVLDVIGGAAAAAEDDEDGVAERSAVVSWSSVRRRV